MIYVNTQTSNKNARINIPTHINVYYQNVRGLRTKLDYLIHNVPLHDYDVIIFTETWLNSSFFDSELGLSNYEIFRFDRVGDNSNKRGGGVLIAICKTYSSHIITVDDHNLETVFVQIKLNNRYLIINAFYHAKPNTDILTNYTKILEEVFSKYPDSYYSVFGDFNLPFLDWVSEKDSPRLNPENSNTVSDILIHSTSFLGLSQINNCRNVLNRILDLVFVNVDCFNICVSDDPLIPLDAYHPALVIKLNLNSNNSNNLEPYKINKLCIRRANFESLNEYLEKINWVPHLEPTQSLDTNINSFYNIINTGISHFIPSMTTCKKKFPIWFSKTLKDKIIEKKILHKKFKVTKNPILYNQFKKIRQKCKTISNKDYADYIKKVEQTLQTNPRKLFDFVRSKKRDNGFPKTMHLFDHSTVKGTDTANLFAQHFSSVYSEESLCSPCFTYDHHISPSLSCIEISEDNVYKKLCGIKPLSSYGPDGVPPIVLKKCATQLVIPLTYLFNRSILEGYIPKPWKKSFVKPFHKSGNKADVQNYRPISNISAVPKLFESIVYDKVKDILNPLITEQQHGFVKFRSTSTNLISFYQFLTSVLDQGDQVDVLYSDFSKAFDKVNINILITKMQTLGISDPLLSWFRSYLTERTQVIQVENFLSDEIPVTSGCPQGGHLSGFLFNLFINDLSCLCGGSADIQRWFFADDYRVALRITKPDDCEQLQNALLELVNWCELNRMQLNVGKCYAVTFNRKKSPIIYNYNINGQQLSRKYTIKDLGIFLDHDLKFSSHIDYIISKGYQNLGFIERNSRHFKNPNTFKSLYCSIVRSSLEYCSPLWSPHYSTHKENIEKIQKKFLRSLGFKDQQIIDNHDYNTIMKKYHINTLQHRRDVFDILLIKKIINNQIQCPDLLHLLTFRCSSVNTRNKDIFFIKTSKTNIAKNAPLDRGMELCNLINNPPHNIDIIADSMLSVKKYLLDQDSLR